MRKNRFFGCFLAVTLAMVFWGCSSEKYVGDGYDVRGMGIVNDTMAMLAFQYWERWEKDGGLAGYDDVWLEYKDWILKVVDTRYKHVYWEGRIKADGYSVSYSLTDSVMVFWNGDFLFWKIGVESPSPMKIERTENISFSRIRPWKDGKLLLNGADRYALLDTIEKKTQIWSFSENFEWVLHCLDSRWTSVGGVCLSQNSNEFFLLKEGVDTLSSHFFTDTSQVNKCFSIAEMFSRRCSWDKPRTIFFLENDGHISNKRPIWYSGQGIFRDSLGNEISYQ